MAEAMGLAAHANLFFSPFSILTHLSQMEFPILINCTSSFPFEGLLGGISVFYSNSNRNFCKQTVENLIRRRILRRLIWFLHCLPLSHKKDSMLTWVYSAMKINTHIDIHFGSRLSVVHKQLSLNVLTSECGSNAYIKCRK